MKKYYQLLLVIVSLVSIVSVIIYRNQYNRLRYVLEVLNFFGKPTDSDNLNCVVIDNVTLHNNIYNVPIPAWQSLGNSYYIYSAFWNTNHEGGSARAIAITTASLIPALMCSLWFSDQEKPIKGKFSYEEIDNRSNINIYKSYLFSCKVQKDFGTAISVTFYDKSILLTPSIPVFMNKHLKWDDDVVACVVPDNSVRKLTRIVEFLNYYQVLGVKKFIIYDNGHMVPTLTNPAIGLQITVLPWNFPLKVNSSSFKEIIKTDCILRTRKAVDFVAVVNWNELIVPTHHSSLTTLIRDINKPRVINKFSFSVKEFCTDYEDDEKKTQSQIIFHKLHYRKSTDIAQPLISTKYLDSGVTDSIQNVRDSIGVIQRYIKCFDETKTNKLERSSLILRFSTDFIKTLLYRLWILGKLFS